METCIVRNAHSNRNYRVNTLRSHRTKKAFIPPLLLSRTDCSSGPSCWSAVFKEAVSEAAVIVFQWPLGACGDMRCLLLIWLRFDTHFPSLPLPANFVLQFLAQSLDINFADFITSGSDHWLCLWTDYWLKSQWIPWFQI
jgi:hypothetical protein